MKKVFSLLVLFVVLSISLRAGGGQQGSETQAGSGSKLQIRASWWGDTKRHDVYNKIVDEFEKANPDVVVVREPVTWGDYWDKLSVQAAGGNATDFICMHPQFAADYISRGVCEPLDKYIADGVISTEGWSQGIIDTGKFDGKMYMMAMGVSFQGFLVNTGVFKQLGITPPPFEWSWDDVKTIGLKVRAALDAQGRKDAWILGDLSRTMDCFRYFVRQQGREVYDAQGNIGFTPKDAEDWFAMFKEFRDLGISPDAATATEYGEISDKPLEDTLFAQDRSLIELLPINRYWLWSSTFPDKEISVVRMAGSKGSKGVGEYPEGAHYAVYAKSSSPEKKLAAARLINFWLNDARSLKLYQLDQGVPANMPVVREAVVPLLDKYQMTFFNFVNTLSAISPPTPNPPPGAVEITALLRNTAEQVMFNAMSPAQAAKEFYDQAVAIRAKATR
jgi:multiple sugar transport system substrate-binding protein